MYVLLKFGKTNGIINFEIGNTNKTNWKTRMKGDFYNGICYMVIRYFKSVLQRCISGIRIFRDREQ